MRNLMLLGLALLAGCDLPPYRPVTLLASDTAIAIQGAPEFRQDIENMAVSHCRARNLVPRLTVQGASIPPGRGFYFPWYRYECQAAPK